MLHRMVALRGLIDTPEPPHHTLALSPDGSGDHQVGRGAELAMGMIMGRLGRVDERAKKRVTLRRR
jgi:hypothetical protein